MVYVHLVDGFSFRGDHVYYSAFYHRLAQARLAEGIPPPFRLQSLLRHYPSLAWPGLSAKCGVIELVI